MLIDHCTNFEHRQLNGKYIFMQPIEGFLKYVYNFIK